MHSKFTICSSLYLLLTVLAMASGGAGLDLEEDWDDSKKEEVPLDDKKGSGLGLGARDKQKIASMTGKKEGGLDSDDLRKMIKYMETAGYRVSRDGSPQRRRVSHPLLSPPRSQHYIQPPRISTYTGSDSRRDLDFESWLFEVRCLLKDNDYPVTILTQAVRKSLKGDAGRVVLLLGESASVEEILYKLESVYGSISSADTLLQEFFTDCQKDGESISSWACRLEDTLSKVKSKGDFINEESLTCILKTKFWSGLKDDRLKDATRHKFEACVNFDSLLRVVRETEQDLHSSRKVKDSKKVSVRFQVAEPDISQHLKDIVSRLDNLEKRQLSVSQPSSTRLETDIGEIIHRLSAIEAKVGQGARDGQPSGNRRGRGQGRGRGFASNPTLNGQ